MISLFSSNMNPFSSRVFLTFLYPIITSPWHHGMLFHGKWWFWSLDTLWFTTALTWCQQDSIFSVPMGGLRFTYPKPKLDYGVPNEIQSCKKSLHWQTNSSSRSYRARMVISTVTAYGSITVLQKYRQCWYFQLVLYRCIATVVRATSVLQSKLKVFFAKLKVLGSKPRTIHIKICWRMPSCLGRHRQGDPFWQRVCPDIVSHPETQENRSPLQLTFVDFKSTKVF